MHNIGQYRLVRHSFFLNVSRNQSTEIDTFMVSEIGVMMAGESEMAVSTGEGIGRISPSGVKWRGCAFYRTSSTGKLAFLNNLVGLFETDVDTDGNFTEKIWEWK
jgi:hypothetical protein